MALTSICAVASTAHSSCFQTALFTKHTAGQSPAVHLVKIGKDEASQAAQIAMLDALVEVGHGSDSEKLAASTTSPLVLKQRTQSLVHRKVRVGPKHEVAALQPAAREQEPRGP